MVDVGLFSAVTWRSARIALTVLESDSAGHRAAQSTPSRSYSKEALSSR